MKVLIADFDLYSQTGGVQTFYRSIIRNYPAVHFTYLTTTEDPDHPRPENAQAVPLEAHYLPAQFSSCPNLHLRWIHALIAASDIARSVAGRSFDVIDTPDYRTFALFLRPALIHHGVNFERIALAMLGKLSTAIRLNWFQEDIVSPDMALPLMEMHEQLQFLTADLRYSISKTYIDEWKNLSQLGVQYLDPMPFLDIPPVNPAPQSSGPPNLAFIGRTEKRKGPDVFVEIARSLPRAQYGTAYIIGPESHGLDGSSSSVLLEEMIRSRGLDTELRPCQTRQELQSLFARRTFTILPSRYDTFNLVAIHSLLAGCPTAIGANCGVVRFLRENFADIPFVALDTDNVHKSLPEIQWVLENYGEYRAHLLTALASIPSLVPEAALLEIYEDRPHYNEAVRADLAVRYFTLMDTYAPGDTRRWRGAGQPTPGTSHGPGRYLLGLRAALSKLARTF